MRKFKVPPLKSLELPARPINPRALAWSSDAELAVAADDSVLLYVPTYPILDPARPVEIDSDDGAADHDGAAAAAAAAAGPQSSRQPPSGSGQGQQQEGGINGDLGILPAGLPAEFGDEYNEEPLSEDSSDDDEDEDREDEDSASKRNAAGQDVDGDGAAAEAARKGHQFTETYRQIPISYPFLHADLNTHIWQAAGKEMPVIRSGGDDDPAPTLAATSGSRQVGLDDVVTHPGAGVGVIGSSGASMNHVVAVHWSPAGVGRNERPVLAVLTGVGSLAVYGEGCAMPFGNTVKAIRSVDSTDLTANNNNNNNNNIYASRGAKSTDGGNSNNNNSSKKADGRGRGGSARNLQSWVVLWAVGENFVVPGQEEYGYGEYIKAFAWSRAMGRGRALLAYVNDVREMVVLSVGTLFGKRTGDGLEEAVWHVKEVVRMDVGGPHEQVDPHDPDFVPSGSSYCVSWGPWIKSEETWSCLLSYMDRNYVGFRKLTVNTPSWDPKESAVVSCDTEDWSGRCLHLGTDAFLEFEDMLWHVNDKQICRGIVATPWVAEPFEIDLSASSGQPTTHSTDQCGTSYLPSISNTDGTRNNPITGIVVHPIPQSTVSPSLVPIYTAVRLSVTATNTTAWWESNVPSLASMPHDDIASTPHLPNWALEVNKTVTRSMPLGTVSHIQHEPPVPPTLEDGEPREEVPVVLWEDDSGDRDAEEDEEDAELYLAAERDKNFDPWAAEGALVHPFNARVWGIAVSPGGGVTAVLASTQMALRPEKASWATRRSQILFEQLGTHAVARNALPPASPAAPAAMGIDSLGAHEGWRDEASVLVEGLSTEARLWEWMYGGGPSIPNLTPLSNATSNNNDNPTNSKENMADTNTSIQAALDAAAAARRAQIKDMFVPFVAAQTCAICADNKTRFLDRDTKIAYQPLSQQYEYPDPEPGPYPTIATYSHQPGPRQQQQQQKKKQMLDCFCENGHRVAVCGTTGLAIMEPGVSRCCGVCQSRSLMVEYIVKKVLLPAGREDLANTLRELVVVDDICVRCGGKFID